METQMTIEEKGIVISNITGALKNRAKELNKAFDAASTFFSLIGKTDSELRTIQKLCAV